ncbi:MAG: class I SAM-dependent methyltransferase [Gammaproteobacteria bacterium]|nr:methyltransferase [Gammaproteobacteria bacterium]MYF00710.1 class I SAM-dependent methyltransferase [Gammaproteobacteria bacterium]
MRSIVTVSATALILAAYSNDAVFAAENVSADAGLEAVINHERRDQNRGRDEWRNPLDTLSFFGIEPDMTIAEVLPGNGGWYTQILTPLTAEQGRLIGVTYPESLFRQMFSTWNEDSAEGIGADLSQMGRYLSVEGVDSAQPIVGYAIDDIPDQENGQADAVLFFRAMHHLFRFDEPIIDTALSETYDMLASGGVAGVVQHRAPEDADPGFANGNNGYLKQSDVVAAFERAGFVLEEASEINANPNDPADSFVWRLPPTTTDNPDTQAIGESDRMTLRFRKP